MSISILPPVLDSDKPKQMAQFSSMLNSFIFAMDTMRYNEFEYVVTDIPKLYATITGNAFVLDRAVNGMMGDYRHEMYCFIRQQLILMVNTVISAIELQSKIDYDVIETVKDCPVQLKAPISELRLEEFEILRKCEGMDKYAESYPTEHALLSGTFTDLQSILHGLVLRFREVAAAPGYDKVNRKSTQFDYTSTKVLVTLGHLIGHVSRSILIAKTYFDTDYEKDKGKIDQTLVYDEYARYSNLGSMSVAGILCCFKREALFPMAVINPTGSLGELEREFLINILVLSKLT